MDLRTYFYGLDPIEREAFAQRAETTVGYIQCHLITRRKIPRLHSMRKLAAASDNRVSLDDLLAYFYKADKKATQSILSRRS
ncbi:MAG: hypothetical protein ACREV3_03320 [Gammaproteobacteria bacterium]